MDFYSKTVNQLIEELSRLPGAAGAVDGECAQQYPLLQGMLHIDRSGAMSDLWQCKERQVSDYGGGNFQRSGSL